jgi:hypothetical protein
MKKIGLMTAAALSLWLGAGTVYAHGDEVHADASKAANGGQVQAAGQNFFELVVTKTSKEAGDNPVVVYITDSSGKKLPSAGAIGTTTLLSGKAKTLVTLTPDGDNRMKGIGKYASNPAMKAIVSITLPGKATEQARFTSLSAASDEHTDHKH